MTGVRPSEQHRAAQRRIVGVIRSCGVLSEDGLAMWRENGSGEWKASAAEIAADLTVLDVAHTVVATPMPPLKSDRSRRIRHGQEVRVATGDLASLVRWMPSLQKHIDTLAEGAGS